MTKRFQISLPDDVAATLEKLSVDCSLPQSVVITQLVVRYQSQLRQLLSVDCNLLQPTATSVQPTPQTTVEPSIKASEVLPTATQPRTPMKPF